MVPLSRELHTGRISFLILSILFYIYLVNTTVLLTCSMPQSPSTGKKSDRFGDRIALTASKRSAESNRNPPVTVPSPLPSPPPGLPAEPSPPRPRLLSTVPETEQSWTKCELLPDVYTSENEMVCTAEAYTLGETGDTISPFTTGRTNIAHLVASPHVTSTVYHPLAHQAMIRSDPLPFHHRPPPMLLFLFLLPPYTWRIFLPFPRQGLATHLPHWLSTSNTPSSRDPGVRGCRGCDWSSWDYRRSSHL